MGRSNRDTNILHISDLQAGESCLAELPIVGDEKTDDLYARYAQKLARDALAVSEDQVDLIAVTGDIAQRGQPDEYRKAKVFLKSLVHTIGAGWERLLVVPGNHDINRLDAKYEFQKKYGDQEFNVLDVNHCEAVTRGKMNTFRSWFDDLYRRQRVPYRYLPGNPLEFRVLNDLCLVGLDSCERQSFRDEENYGFIGQTQLDKAAQIFRSKGKNKMKLALMHHNPFPVENESNGLREADRVLSFLKSQGVTLIFAGHMHRGRLMEHLIYGGDAESHGDRVYTFVTGPCCMQYKDRAFTIRKLMEVLPNRYELIQLRPRGANAHVKAILRRFTVERDSDGTVGAWTSDLDLPYAREDGSTELRIPRAADPSRLSVTLLADLEQLADKGSLPET